MINTSRRGFLIGLTGLVASPALVRFDSLMPLKVLHLPVYSYKQLKYATYMRDGMIMLGADGLGGKMEIITPEALSEALSQPVTGLVFNKSFKNNFLSIDWNGVVEAEGYDDETVRALEKKYNRKPTPQGLEDGLIHDIRHCSPANEQKKGFIRAIRESMGKPEGTNWEYFISSDSMVPSRSVKLRRRVLRAKSDENRTDYKNPPPERLSVQAGADTVDGRDDRAGNILPANRKAEDK